MSACLPVARGRARSRIRGYPPLRTLAALALAGGLVAGSISCGGATAVMVHLTTPKDRPLTPGTDFTSMVIIVTQGGQPIAQTTKPFQIGETFPQTLSILPGQKTGPGDEITVTADAEDQYGSVVQSADAKVTFKAGEVVDVTLELPAP